MKISAWSDPPADLTLIWVPGDSGRLVTISPNSVGEVTPCEAGEFETPGARLIFPFEPRRRIWLQSEKITVAVRQ